MKNYKEIYCCGMTTKFASLLYDEVTDYLVYAVISTTSRQVTDYILSNFQGPTTFRYNDNVIRTEKNSYVGRIAKAKNENISDGVHALITYNDTNKILKIFKGENAGDKLYSWLIKNTEVGILEEWSEYFFSEFCKRGVLRKCKGFDNTGTAPEIYYFDETNTKKENLNDLVSSIKSLGLKLKEITLDTEYSPLPCEATFVEIIEDYIIPNVGDIKNRYNIGDPISNIFKTPIISGKDKFYLYDKQIVIAQGMLEGIKANVDYNIMTCGQGTGKTYMSSKLSLAVIKEHFKKEDGRIILLCPSHLKYKWEKQINECYLGAGVIPKVKFIENISDVDKLDKKPKGIEVLILTRDKAKRTYLVEDMSINKYNAYKSNEINKRINKIVSDNKDKDFIFEEVSSTKGMNYICSRVSNELILPVVLYCKFTEDGKEGYYIRTNSNAFDISKKFIKSNSVYNYKFYGNFESLSESFRNLIKFMFNNFTSRKKSLTKEEHIKKLNELSKLVCPCCGLPLYKCEGDFLELERYNKFIKFKKEKVTSNSKKCKAYLKADGTHLNDYELNLIRTGSISYTVVEKKTKNCYLDAEGNSISKEEFNKIFKMGNGDNLKIVLKKCNAELVGAKNAKGYKTVSIGEYMLRKLGKKNVDITIVDEVHQYLAADSLQATLHSELCRLSKVNIVMTGTLTSGRASDLFYLLFKLKPKRMLDLGFGYHDVARFVDEFGRRKNEIVTYESYISQSGVSKVEKGWSEIPGISPLLYSTYLANNMVARKIEDLSIDKLPKITFIKNEIEMDEDLAEGYEKYLNQFMTFRSNNFGVPVSAIMQHSLLSYVDNPIQEMNYLNYKGEKIYVATPPPINMEEGRLLNKERKLLEVLSKEISQGKKCLVYVSYTGEKAVHKRLEKIIKDYGLSVAVMENIQSSKREEWIDKQHKKGIDILIVNPIAVSTGLDIIHYPIIYYYEIPMSTTVFRQSTSRNLRLNSYQDGKVYFSYYKNTLQETLAFLQGDKKKASLALEGCFGEELLSSLGDSGKSIEEMLNDVISGKIKLKEEMLDGFNFTSEEEENNIIISSDNASEIEYQFEDDLLGNCTISKRTIFEEQVTVSRDKVEGMQTLLDLDKLFVVNESSNNKSKKKKNNPTIGQIGFLF